MQMSPGKQCCTAFEAVRFIINRRAGSAASEEGFSTPKTPFSKGAPLDAQQSFLREPDAETPLHQSTKDNVSLLRRLEEHCPRPRALFHLLQRPQGLLRVLDELPGTSSQKAKERHRGALFRLRESSPNALPG
jgi:hypothetical protein